MFYPCVFVSPMISFRSLLVLVPLLALGACDNDPAPPIKPVEPPKPGVSAPAAAVPALAPAPEAPAKQTSAPVKPSPPPKPAVSVPALKDEPDPVVAETPIPALDLSLPEELLKPTESVESFSELPSALLPPLFDERDGPDSPFQLQGKLITGERDDQHYWKSLDGAELQFEFKR